MKAKGFATLMASSLDCCVANADWHFLVRRVDGKSHGEFFNFHEKVVSEIDVAKYIPNWKSLHWINIKDSELSKSESYAKDVEFMVNVSSSVNGKKTHAEVIDAFLSFMKN